MVTKTSASGPGRQHHPRLIWLTPVLIVVAGVIGALTSAPWWVLSLIGAVLAVFLILGDIVIERRRKKQPR